MASDALSLSYDELQAWLRLTLTPSLGNAAIRRLLVQFGTPQSVLTQSPADWRACLSQSQCMQLAQPPDTLPQALRRTWDWLQASTEAVQHTIIALGDPRYPPMLLQIEDPPLLLYAIGAARWLQRPAPLLDSSKALAVVGSRNPTAQGAENARQFAQALAQHGWCVVSGLAAGVDAAAHTGALQADAAADASQPPTVAVVGTGVDRIYPRQNAALAHQIAARGVILSEYALGTPPIASNFPKRNRIIAGLSWGTLVVEAAMASGSLITARLAAEQGREVFAIPGSIHAPQSKGCHALLRQGAKLVECAQDIWEELPATSPTPHPIHTSKPPQAALTTAKQPEVGPTPAPAPSLPADGEHPLWQALGYDPMTLDALQAYSGWETAALQAWLLEQELEGHIARLPGGRVQRIARS